MTALRFFVPGPPRGKGRPRLGRGGRTFTDPATVAYERRVRSAALDLLTGPRFAGTVAVFPEGALSLDVVAVSRVAGKAPLALCCRSTGKGSPRPDGDNVLKIVSDALNGLVWRDDSQIATWSCYRLEAGRDWTGEAPEEGVYVSVAPAGYEARDEAVAFCRWVRDGARVEAAS